MEGIAQELGRIEDKMAQLLQQTCDPGPGGDPPPPADLGELRELLQLVRKPDPAGAYLLAGPCNPTGPGSAADPLEAAWPPTEGLGPAVLKRLDALAELLQHHKSLRQPICPPGRAVGTPVTVTFQEIEGE